METLIVVNMEITNQLTTLVMAIPNQSAPTFKVKLHKFKV